MCLGGWLAREPKLNPSSSSPAPPPLNLSSPAPPPSFFITFSSYCKLNDPVTQTSKWAKKVDFEGRGEGEEERVEVRSKPRQKGKQDKPKPWDDGRIDHWKVEKFDPTWNEGGMLEISSFTTLFPQYREKYVQDVWPSVRGALKHHGISCELNAQSGKERLRGGGGAGEVKRRRRRRGGAWVQLGFTCQPPSQKRAQEGPDSQAGSLELFILNDERKL